MKKSFLRNTADVTKKIGVPVASVGFAFGSYLLFKQIDMHHLKLFRNVLWPALSIGGAVAGLFNAKRTQNTFSMAGAAAKNLPA